MPTIPVRQGISSSSVINIPAKWDREWFRRLITTHLVNADVRNAQTSGGITITGTPSTPGMVSLGTNAVPPTALQAIAATSILGNPTNVSGSVVAITAGSDNLILQRTAGALSFGLLSPSSLQTIASHTVLGNASGGTATPSALSTAQLTTLVNTFTSTLSGAVPASGGGTTNFLRADGSFTTPSKLTTQTTGWGSPTGAGVLSNFSGGSATLAQVTEVVAQIIVDLKTLGLYGA